MAVKLVSGFLENVPCEILYVRFFRVPGLFQILFKMKEGIGKF